MNELLVAASRSNLGGSLPNKFVVVVVPHLPSLLIVQLRHLHPLQLTRPMIWCCCMSYNNYNNIRMHLTSPHPTSPFSFGLVPPFRPTSRGEAERKGWGGVGWGGEGIEGLVTTLCFWCGDGVIKFEFKLLLVWKAQ